MRERFGIAAFRSRQQVMRFDAELRKRGINSSIISTPKSVSLGCGLSVRFAPEDMDRAITEYRRMSLTALVGFYLVDRDADRLNIVGVKVYSLD